MDLGLSTCCSSCASVKAKSEAEIVVFGGKEWVKYLHLGFRLTRKVTVYGFLAGKGGAVWIFMDILFRHKIF